MRHLGIDYGTKRVGVAVSDVSGTMAFPHSVVPNDAQLLPTLTDLIAEQEVGTVVVGHSLNRQAEPNPVQEDIDQFVTKLEAATSISVHLQPEQYTTQAALRLQGRNEQTDASAAALILDSYFLLHSKS